MKKQARYFPEVIERAIHMVNEANGQYESKWLAVAFIAAKFGCTAEELRRWVRKDGHDTGQRPGSTSAEQQQINAWEREVRELRKANEILPLASAFFAQAERDRRFKP